MAQGTALPPRLDELNKIIQHNVSPAPGEEMTGEVHVDPAGNQFPVYRLREPVMAKRPKRDVDGNIMYHLRADGSKHRQMMEEVQVGERVREFVLIPLGNGIVQRNFNFRPTPEELKTRTLEQENVRSEAKLKAMLAAGGKSFTDVVSALEGLVGVQRHEEAPAPAPEASGPLPEPSVEDTKDENEEQEETRLERFKRLQQRAKDEGMEVEGTGKKGAVTLKDLEAAFADADEAPPNTE